MQWLVERYEYKDDSSGSVPHQPKENDDEYNVEKTMMIATGCRQNAADVNEEVSMSLDTKDLGLGTFLPPFVTVLMDSLLFISLDRIVHSPR